MKRLALLTALLTVAVAPAATAAPPPNDNFGTLTSLTGNAPLISGTNVEATGEANELNHGAASLRAGCADSTNPDTGCNPSVWYGWTPPASGRAAFEICNASFDSLVSVYTGAAVNSTIEVARSDNGCDAGGGSRVGFPVTAGQNYKIVVSGKAAATGAFSGRLALAPANDNFPGTALAGSTAGATGSNFGATGQTGEPNLGDWLGSDCLLPDNPNIGCASSVWWSWTAAGSGPATVSTCGTTDVNTLLAVYSGSALNALSTVATNDDSPACGVMSIASRVTFQATAGRTYRIAVGGAGAESGPLQLSIAGAGPPPKNGGTTKPPADKTYAGVAVTFPKSLTVRRGRVRFRLESAEDATGTLSAKTTKRFAVASQGKRKAKKRKLSVGSVKFTLRAGKRKTVTLKLKKAARRLLKSKGSLRVRVTIRARDKAGNVKPSGGTVTLKAPKPKKPKKPKKR